MNIADKRVVIKKAEDMEIRILSNGNIAIKGKLPYNSKSGTLFNKTRRIMFTEQVAPMAFTSCLSQQDSIPKLIFNHKMDDEVGEIVSFEYEDTDNKDFKFSYVITPTKKLLENIDNISNFSFGFFVGDDEWQKVGNVGVEYVRTIYTFKGITEFSLLLGLESAYPKARIFLDDEAMTKEEVTEFVAEVKSFIASQKEKEIQEIKDFIIKAKR